MVVELKKPPFKNYLLMVNYKASSRNSLLAILMLVLFACEKKDTGLVNNDRNPLIGVWQYTSISVDGYDFLFASNNLEPGEYKDALGGERAELARRHIKYFEDGTYQLQWADRGDYSLGTEGDPNWQPSFGYYQLNEAGDSLIHNKGLPYETFYLLSIDGKQMLRTSQRYMSENSTEYGSRDLWRRGNIVEFTEVFEVF